MDRRGIPGELRRAQREPGGMAGESGGNAAARGPGNPPRIKRLRSQRALAAELAARHANRAGARARLPAFPFGILKYLALAAALLLAAALPAFGAEAILASRVWPAQEYTRVTLESARPVKHAFFFVDNPPRLVVDLENVSVGIELKALPERIGDKDPYISAVRVGLNRPNVTRVVFDLRTEVKPSIFPLAPVGEYRHRLVIDLYPAKPADPLLALVQPPDPIGEIARSQVTTVPEEGPVASAPKADAPQPDAAKEMARAAERPAAKVAERKGP